MTAAAAAAAAMAVARARPRPRAAGGRRRGAASPPPALFSAAAGRGPAATSIQTCSGPLPAPLPSPPLKAAPPLPVLPGATHGRRRAATRRARRRPGCKCSLPKPDLNRRQAAAAAPPPPGLSRAACARWRRLRGQPPALAPPRLRREGCSGSGGGAWACSHPPCVPPAAAGAQRSRPGDAACPAFIRHSSGTRTPAAAPLDLAALSARRYESGYNTTPHPSRARCPAPAAPHSQRRDCPRPAPVRCTPLPLACRPQRLLAQFIVDRNLLQPRRRAAARSQAQRAAAAPRGRTAAMTSTGWRVVSETVGSRAPGGAPRRRGAGLDHAPAPRAPRAPR
jgi:hypothetical protein